MFIDVVIDAFMQVCIWVCFSDVLKHSTAVFSAAECYVYKKQTPKFFLTISYVVSLRHEA